MTEIPGTSKLTPQLKRKNRDQNDSKHVEKITTVNISELEKAKNRPKPQPEDKLWFNRLRYWVLIGFAAGLIFIPLALLVNWRFIFLSILGPLSGWISWYMKMFSRKHGKETDNYIRRN